MNFDEKNLAALAQSAWAASAKNGGDEPSRWLSVVRLVLLNIPEIVNPAGLTQQSFEEYRLRVVHHFQSRTEAEQEAEHKDGQPNFVTRKSPVAMLQTMYGAPPRKLLEGGPVEPYTNLEMESDEIYHARLIKYFTEI